MSVEFVNTSAGRACVILPILDDGAVELEESFQLNLFPESPFVNITSSNTTVVITDDDSRCLC